MMAELVCVHMPVWSTGHVTPPSTSLSCPSVTTRQCKRVSTCVMAKPRAVPKCFSCKMHATCVCVYVQVFPALRGVFYRIGGLDKHLSVGSSGGCSFNYKKVLMTVE